MMETEQNLTLPEIEQDTSKYKKHINDLIEDAEIEAEMEAEKKIRSKNSRVFSISMLGLVLLTMVYVQMNTPSTPGTILEKKDSVIFGSTVELKDLESNEKKIYKIVGKDEADLKKNLLYFRSPIGKGLIGKNKKDLISIKTPSGEKNFEIIEVKYI